jgi:hypothetical protein
LTGYFKALLLQNQFRESEAMSLSEVHTPKYVFYVGCVGWAIPGECQPQGQSFKIGLGHHEIHHFKAE